MRYAVEVRAREDNRLLGHVDMPMPSHELPEQWTFELRRPTPGAHQIGSYVRVTLMVAVFFEDNSRWLAFSAPAAQWDEIKDLIR